MMPAQLENGAKTFVPVTGGAAVNSAIALARLGISSGVFAALSSDQFGRFLRQALQAEGVADTLCPTLDAPSTLAFIAPKGETQSFDFFDENSAARLMTHIHMPPLQGVTALVFGGISLIRKPAAGVFEAVMSSAPAHCITLLDPNIRPSFVSDESAYRERLRRMMAMADIIKLSDEDIEWFQEDTAEALLCNRAAIVLHTHGAQGATMYSRHGKFHAHAPKTTVVDTVGAGDTFNAAFLAHLAKYDVLEPRKLALCSAPILQAALEFAVKAATISVARVGANPPNIKELS